MQQADEVYKEKMKELWIETLSGQSFYLLGSNEFDIQDISGALQKLCRYNGHCKQFYSVAQHSILVSQIMKDLTLGDPFEGLMHDATEAYLADIPSPWKVLLPEYKKLESDLDLRMRKYFKLPLKITEGCKTADYIALFVEAQELVVSKGVNWFAPDGIKLAAMDYIERFKPQVTKIDGSKFIEKFQFFTV